MAKQLNEGAIPRKGQVLFASYEDNKISVMVNIDADEEHGLQEESGSMELPTRRFDKDKNALVSDEDMFERTIESLIALGAPESVRDMKDTEDFTDIAGELIDNEVTVYFGEVRDKSITSTRPIKSFTRADELSVADLKELKKYNEPVLVTTYEEMDNIRFNLFGTVNLNSGPKVIRITSLEIESDNINEKNKTYKLNYLPKTEQKMYSKLRDGVVTGERAETLEHSIKTIAERARKLKVDELKDALDGRDITELMDNPEPIEVSIEMRQVGNDGDPYFIGVVTDQHPSVEETEAI